MKFLEKYYHDISSAFEAIILNKLKSFLTALGIVFGVAAVISMLAIGKGAQKEILEQIKLVGVNNIIITPILDDKQNNEISEDESDKNKKEKFSKGLNIADVISIKEIIPTIKYVSPEINIETNLINKGKHEEVKLLGVTAYYFKLFNLELEKGTFFGNYQEKYGKPICIISNNLKTKLFNTEDPIGKQIKCGGIWLKIVGILKSRTVSENKLQELKLNKSNSEVYIPLKTMLMYYSNREKISSEMVSDRKYFEEEHPDWKYNQLDKITIQVEETEQLIPTTKIIDRMLLRRHSGIADFEITVPELLLKQQQKTKDVFNIVLAVIAGISLLVGGIGIMNIMLASVMERIKEIGTRQALGATKKDIVIQFLAESIMISVSGGIIGIILGIVMSGLIQKVSGILTIVSISAILISFFVSIFIGIIFGYMPAKKAAEKNPIESLRYE
ncbi:MAG: ABC transporter permease [Bacteroidota bacterium]|nr:ABC transporter permease [Bacteroidota bacterium]